ncbi:MAG: hypothetical protein ACK4RV_11695 [Caulobacter sp.]
MSRLDRTTAALLRQRAERLHAAADRLVRLDGELVAWGVSRRVARAYVWASHQGEDLHAAIRRLLAGSASSPGVDRWISKIVAHLQRTEEARP